MSDLFDYSEYSESSGSEHDNEDSAESSFMDLEVEIIPRNAPPVRAIMMNIPLDIRMNGGRVVRGDPNRVVVPPVLEPVTYYDQNLTPAHKYLGDGLHETTGRTIFEEGIIHTIPVIFFNLNLIPGQILPIIARSAHVKAILKYALAGNRVFGVSYKYNENMRTFGTIAEIFEHSLDIETSQSFQVKAMGHQRFEILSIGQFPQRHELPQNIALAQIKIIPDKTLTHPYKNLCLHPRKRNSNHSNMCRKRDMWQTQWPDWVYKQFDVNSLAKRLAEKVKLLYKDAKIPDDPSVLSLQVTRLGIFNQEQASYLLGLKSTNLRLQYELHYWDKNQTMQKFLCARCSFSVCNMSSVFPMSPEGPQGTYCNSWGQIHDMITVTELDDDVDVITVGSPSTECCWFPGYKWLIILCPSCQGHLGWRYLANEDSTLMPRIFYGLAMRSITSIQDYMQQLDSNNDRLEQINDGEILVTF